MSTSRGNEIKSVENLIKSDLSPYLPSEIEDHLKILIEIKHFFDSYQTVLDVSFFSGETTALLAAFYSNEIKQQLKNVSQIANLIDYKV